MTVGDAIQILQQYSSDAPLIVRETSIFEEDELEYFYEIKTEDIYEQDLHYVNEDGEESHTNVAVVIKTM